MKNPREFFPKGVSKMKVVNKNDIVINQPKGKNRYANAYMQLSKNFKLVSYCTPKGVVACSDKVKKPPLQRKLWHDAYANLRGNIGF